MKATSQLQVEFAPRWLHPEAHRTSVKRARELVPEDLIDILFIDEQIVPLLRRPSLADSTK